VLVDGCSRLAVGHAIGEHPDVALAVGALELAVGRRGGVVDQAGGLVCHTDQGSTYTAARFSKRLQRPGIRASMGSVGDCFDHALVESFNATLACELIDRRTWKTKAEARREVFYWIEALYNRTRRHSALGYLSPVEYEATLSMTPTTSDPST
jgi:putative transposase